MFKKQFDEILSTIYQLLSDYRTSKTKVLVKHNICNKTYYTLPSDILQNNKRIHEEFLLEFTRQSSLSDDLEQFRKQQQDQQKTISRDAQRRAKTVQRTNNDR